MPDFAGAVAAIRQRLAANWTATLILYPNEAPPDGFPRTDPATGNPAPWVLAEVVSDGSPILGAGTPGRHVWLYEGWIFLHVFVDRNSGTDVARAHAVALGEIYRGQQFYDDTPGYCVRSGLSRGGQGPQIDGGGISEDSSGRPWFRTTARVPFQYWHLG